MRYDMNGNPRIVQNKYYQTRYKAPINHNRGVIMNVEEEPFRKEYYRPNYEVYQDRPMSDGHLEKGQVIIVNRDGWNDVRHGRMVDEMTPEEYAAHVERHGMNGRRTRPAGRRGARRVKQAIRYNHEESEYEDDDYEDEEIGPSASQQPSVTDDQSNLELDEDGPSRLKGNRLGLDSSSSEYDTDQLKFSRHNNGGKAVPNVRFSKGTNQRDEQQEGKSGITGKNVTFNTRLHSTLEDLNEEEEGQLTSASSKRSVRKKGEAIPPVRKPEELPPVSEDYQLIELGNFAVKENQNQDQSEAIRQTELRAGSQKTPDNQDVKVLETKVEIHPDPSGDVSNLETTEQTQKTEVSTTVNESIVTTNTKNTILMGQTVEEDSSESLRNITDQSDQTKPVNAEEDDQDSGISRSSLKMRQNPYLEKKSVFTIAYDGMQSKHGVVQNADIIRTPTP